MDLQFGDIVITTRDGYLYEKGEIGTILGISGIIAEVSFKEYSLGRHDLSGKTRAGHGAYVNLSSLVREGERLPADNEIVKADKKANSTNTVKDRPYVSTYKVEKDEKLEGQKNLSHQAGWYIYNSSLQLSEENLESVVLEYGGDGKYAWVRATDRTPPGAIINKTTNMNKIQKLTSNLKRFLSKDLQTLFKAGYINGGLELTERGKQGLSDILYDKYMKELVASADAHIKEVEKEEDK